MSGTSSRHAEVLEELAEWWQDVSSGGIGSRAVLVPAPRGWGRTRLLASLRAMAGAEDAVRFVVAMDGAARPDGAGMQARMLRNRLAEAGLSRNAFAATLGVDRPGDMAQKGLGVAGLFVPQLMAAGMLLATFGIEIASRVWDDTPAGEAGDLARTARAAAAVSERAPVLVTVDDADLLDPLLAVRLIESLIGRLDGQVLVAATAAPDSDLFRALQSRPGYGRPGSRVLLADADPDMSYPARAGLATELLPALPAVVAERIGQRTRTFAEVFAVACAEVLEDADPGNGAACLAAADEVLDALDRPVPSRAAAITAWAGGMLHAAQLKATLGADAAPNEDGGLYLSRSGDLVRVADPESPRLAEQIRLLAPRIRKRLATILLDQALAVITVPESGVVERVVACRAVHHVRDQIDDSTGLRAAQLDLVRGLEAAGDFAEAFQVATTALAEHADGQPSGDAARVHSDLSAAMLRLAAVRSDLPEDPVVVEAIRFAASGGAAIGLEARVWAAVNLLAEPGRREQALDLASRLAAELGKDNVLGTGADH